MLRQNLGQSRYIGGACRTRKRGSSSSSASSTVLHSCRFKRAIMVGKRGGSFTTPAPNWRMNPKSPSATSRISESSRCNGIQGPVSARKLTNALWELNRIPLPQFTEDFPIRRSKEKPKSLPHQLFDPIHRPTSIRSERMRSSRNKKILPMVCQISQCNEHNHGALDLLSTDNLREIESRSHGFTPRSSIVGTKIHLKELRNSLTTSKDLAKLLKDQHSYGISLPSALRVELDEAHVQLDHLMQEQGLERREINCLKKQFMEEKSLWKRKEQERIRAAVNSIMEELESEKKLRRRAERLNKKLGLELANTRATLSKAIEELESEKRSREIIEQICNEIMKEIGHDKAEVEQIKRESAKVQDELEKEREMLHLADVLREERIQMKLLEAKVQFEKKKNAAVEQLRNDFEACLDTTRSKDEILLEERGEVEDGGEDNERDSTESDLHSIELNIESNNRGYSWSYAPKAAEADANNSIS